MFQVFFRALTNYSFTLRATFQNFWLLPSPSTPSLEELSNKVPLFPEGNLFETSGEDKTSTLLTILVNSSHYLLTTALLKFHPLVNVVQRIL